MWFDWCIDVFHGSFYAFSDSPDILYGSVTVILCVSFLCYTFLYGVPAFNPFRILTVCEGFVYVYLLLLSILCVCDDCVLTDVLSRY